MKQTTAAFVFISLFVFAAAWIGYDLWAISKEGTEASISFMFLEWSYKYPMFTWTMGFAPGLLVGHFFWRIRDTKRTLELSEDSRK